jgi:hypothetical protein
MEINIRTNFPDVAARLGKLQDAMAAQVLARSLNRTVEQARTLMSQRIRAEFNLSAAYVRERLSIKRAFAKSGQFSLAAELRGGRGQRRSANVIAFGARLGKGGVSVLIKRRGRKVIKGAFIGNKGRTVFERVDNTTMGSRSQSKGAKHRQKIKPVQTIEVAQMFNTRRINAAVVAAMQAKFPAIFERELRYAISRAGL